MGLILLIILVVLLVAAVPRWGYSRGWGWGPGGLLGLLLIVLVVLVLLGHIPTSWGQDAGTVTVVEAEEPGALDETIDYLVDFVIVVVGGALAWVSTVVVGFVRAKIGDLAADKLKGALDRAAAVGQAAAGNAVRAGADYLKEQLPDTIKTLKMSDAQVEGIVSAKITEDKAAAAAMPTPSPASSGITP